MISINKFNSTSVAIMMNEIKYKGAILVPQFSPLTQSGGTLEQSHMIMFQLSPVITITNVSMACPKFLKLM